MIDFNLPCWFQLIILVKLNAATFFHEPSYLEIEPLEKGTDFGVTMDYDSNGSLVVGAPFSNQNGKVYTCLINEDLLTSKKTVCTQIDIDIDKEVPNHSRLQIPQHRYGLGASIAVTPDYIFICAPLLTQEISTENGTVFGAYGTCFKSNGTSTSRYFGLMEQYEKEMNDGALYSTIDIKSFQGGVGWTTLADVANKLILIAKPSGPYSALHYLEMDEPSEAVKLVEETTNWDTTAVYNSLNNKGTAFAAGSFFKGHSTLYAFSAEDKRKYGLIAFLSYDITSKKMDLLKSDKRGVVTILDTQVGAMFGSSLHSMNIDSDKYTDLLVGAPAHVQRDGGYENGAIHIYLGGDTRGRGRPNLRKLCIYSIKDASRFGTSIATADIDGDSYPEIFVSAPYEGEGAVYIISGYEVKNVFQKKKKSVDILLSDLIYTQRIQNSKFETLGFSLLALPVPQFDKNGQYFLAMGSPQSGKVVLYRSVPVITADIKTSLKGVRVREQDNNFTMSVVVDITYPSKLKMMTGKITVTTSIDGDAAWIENGGNYDILLSEIKPSGSKTAVSRDIVVLLGNNKPGIYTFVASVESDTENLKRLDFDPSLVAISPRSQKVARSVFKRECNVDMKECIPKLSLTFEWSGSNETHYTLGSTDAETVTLVIRNDGTATFGSCARIKVTGAQIAFLEGTLEDDGWYTCDLTIIERYTEFRIPISLDMSKPTNKHESIVIKVVLYNTCTSDIDATNYSRTIQYEFISDEINFNSTHYNHVVTDREIEDDEAGPNIEIHELYTITNTANMTWSSLPLEFYVEEESFVTDCLIQVDSGDCQKSELNLKYNCTVDLKPDSTTIVKSTVTIVKTKIMDNLKNNTLSIVSHLKMNMVPSLKTLENMYITEIVYEETIGLENNMYIVLAISILVGFFVMAVIVVLLSKGGFFKRAEKQKLVMLKHEIRKQSIRRATIDCGAQVVLEPNPEQSGEEPRGSEESHSEKSSPGEDGVTRRKKSQIAQQDNNDDSRGSNNSDL